MAASETQVTDVPPGDRVGATTKAASTWGAGGASVGSAVGFLLTYLLVKTQLESDPEQAITVGACLSVVLTWIGGKLAGQEGGKRTPTDQTRDVERVVVHEVEPADPELRDAILGIAREAGLVPGPEPETELSPEEPATGALSGSTALPGTTGRHAAAEPGDGHTGPLVVVPPADTM